VGFIEEDCASENLVYRVQRISAEDRD